MKLLLKLGMRTKKVCCIVKAMFIIHENILNYFYNPLKYKKLYNELYNKLSLNFILDKICL